MTTPQRGETTLTWEDPPVTGPRAPRKKWWEDVIHKVTERPGYWACIRTYSSSPYAAGMAAKNLRQHYANGAMPHGRWEIRAANSEGVGKVYVRYTEGDPE